MIQIHFYHTKMRGHGICKYEITIIVIVVLFHVCLLVVGYILSDPETKCQGCISDLKYYTI